MVDGIGIDLGTRTSAIAIVAGGVAEVLADRQGEPLLPSVVYLGPGRLVHTGEAARPYAAVEPERTIDDFLRLVGRPFAGEASVAAHTRLTWALGPTASGGVGVEIDGRVHALTGCAAMLCATLQQRLPPAAATGRRPSAMAVPARATTSQRRALRAAASRAGFEAPRLVSTPLAVARAWAEQRGATGRGTSTRMLVVDVGASGFEAAVVALEPRLIEVQAVVGEAGLGGQAVDLALADLIAERFTEHTGLEARPDPAGYAVVRSHAEWARAMLAVEPEVEVRIPEVAELAAGAVDLVERLTRDDLTGLMRGPIEQMIAWSDLAVARVGIDPKALDAVLLVGGVASTPALRDAFAEWSGGPIAELTAGQLAAARGAALLAGAGDMPGGWMTIDACAPGLYIGRDPNDTVPVVPPDCPLPVSVGPVVPAGQQPVRLYQGEGGELDGLVGEVLVTGEEPMRLQIDIDRDGIVAVEVVPVIDPSLLEPLDLSLDGSMVDISAMLESVSISGVMRPGRAYGPSTTGPMPALRQPRSTTGPLPGPRSPRTRSGPMALGRSRRRSGPVELSRAPRTRSGSMALEGGARARVADDPADSGERRRMSPRPPRLPVATHRRGASPSDGSKKKTPDG